MEKKRIALCFSVSICVVVLSVIICDYAAARPPRPIIRRKMPVVVKPKVVLSTTGTSKKVITKQWPSETITEEKILPEVKEIRNIKPEYGLIDFEVYPYDTKIYVDDKYKGLARSLNEDKASVKVRKGKHLVKLIKDNAPVKVISVVVNEGFKTIINQP